MEREHEIAAMEQVLAALRQLGPEVERMVSQEEQLHDLLQQFVTLVERRAICRRCGGRPLATAAACDRCGEPLPPRASTGIVPN